MAESVKKIVYQLLQGMDKNLGKYLYHKEKRTETDHVKKDPVKSRESFWDILRGILILCTIWGHSLGGWNFAANDYLVPPESFHFTKWMILRAATGCTVPVFIFLSGYMTGENSVRDVKRFILRRFKRIAIPFAVWTVLYSLIEFFVYHNGNVTFLSVVLGTNAVQLYYLLVMLQLTLLTPVFFQCKDKKLVLILCIVINILNGLIHEMYYFRHKTEMAYDMHLCTSFIAYYVLGLYMKHYGVEKIKKLPVWLCGVLALISCSISILSEYIRLQRTGNVLVSVSFNTNWNLLYTFAIIILIFRIREAAVNCSVKWLEWCGRASMEIFLIHWVFENALKLWMINHISIKYLMWCNLLLLIMTVLLSVVSIILYDRIRRGIKKS